MNETPGILTDPQPSLESRPVHLPLVYVKEKPTWEYKQLTRNLEKAQGPIEDALNTLGKDGWELAGILPNPPMVHFYFKRLAG